MRPQIKVVASVLGFLALGGARLAPAQAPGSDSVKKERQAER